MSSLLFNSLQNFYALLKCFLMGNFKQHLMNYYFGDTVLKTDAKEVAHHIVTHYLQFQ